MLPSISILTCTYGRTELLSELIECFDRQSYDGVLELIIINDCPLQTLECNALGVRIINAPSPFSTYADKRNAALDAATGEFVSLWDDDDIYLPTFLASVVSKLQDNDKAMRLSRLMTWDGRFSKVIAGAQYHAAIIKTDELRAIGGWKNVDVTDADLVKRMITYRFFHGAHQHTDDAFPPLMIYRTDPERAHMGVEPRPTREQYMEAMNRRIYAWKEPRGTVDIVPAWSQDWEAFVVAHLPVPVPPQPPVQP